MKEILINDEIGIWGISANMIRDAFQDVPEGEDIKIVIDSPGGDCFEGISIYNFIRNYARTHINNITTYVQGLAASAASWIACAANSVNPNNKIVVEDNSVFMIHNSQSIAIGDYREMKKTGEFCQRIDSVIKTMLAARSGKDTKEIGKLMDSESWYFGNEILENGFADEVVPVGVAGNPTNKEEKLTDAKLNFMTSQKKLKEYAESHSKECKDSFERSLSAFNIFTTLESSESNKVNSSEKSDKKSNLEDSSMTKEELKMQNKALFDEVSADSVNAERQRVSGLLAKFEKAGNASNALAFIKNGKSIADAEVVDALVETAIKAKAVEDRKNDEPPAFVPAPVKETEDEATKEFKAAFGL